MYFIVSRVHGGKNIKITMVRRLPYSYQGYVVEWIPETKTYFGSCEHDYLEECIQRVLATKGKGGKNWYEKKVPVKEVYLCITKTKNKLEFKCLKKLGANTVLNQVVVLNNKKSIFCNCENIIKSIILLLSSTGLKLEKEELYEALYPYAKYWWECDFFKNSNREVLIINAKGGYEAMLLERFEYKEDDSLSSYDFEINKYYGYHQPKYLVGGCMVKDIEEYSLSMQKVKLGQALVNFKDAKDDFFELEVVKLKESTCVKDELTAERKKQDFKNYERSIR